jgi:hypothetical protein
MPDESLLSRDEVTAMLFAIVDIRNDAEDIRDWLLNENDGEGPEANS